MVIVFPNNPPPTLNMALRVRIHVNNLTGLKKKLQRCGSDSKANHNTPKNSVKGKILRYGDAELKKAPKQC